MGEECARRELPAAALTKNEKLVQLFTKNFVTFFVKIKPVKPDFTGLYQTVIGQERVSFTLEISVLIILI